jgi:hypothetical protein
MVGGVHYLNSGDWVESLTAVVEHMDRTFEVITYDEFCRRTNREPKGYAAAVESVVIEGDGTNPQLALEEPPPVV